MEYSKTPEINAAVNWWVETVSVKGKPKFDNGIPGDAAFFETYIETPEPFTPDELERFGKALTHVLERDYESKAKHLYIGTDYEPQELLKETFETALLPPAREMLFPVKTRTWLDDGKFTVRSGYRSETIQVYPKE